MSKAFAQVATLPKVSETNINPRATRYGLLPIWPLPTSARDFYVWEIPANTVFPFRPFIGEIGQDYAGNVLYTTERMPQDQILDMYTASQFFTELAPLTKLGDETKARMVAEALANPTVCDKYPVELGTSCTTCWIKDTLTAMPDRIREKLQDPELQSVALECMGLLREGLSKAIDEARRQLDVAIRDIDDPKSGKSMFFDHDYLNVYHTHSERPQYRTSTSNTNVASQIADAIHSLAKRDEAPSVDIAKIVAEAVAEATKDLREKLATYEQPKSKTEEIVEKVEAAKKKDK